MCAAADEAEEKISYATCCKIARGINEQSPPASGLESSEERVKQFEFTPEFIANAHSVFAKDILLKPFWREKHEREVVRNWDIFYKNNKANFFRDRLWLDKEFQELHTPLLFSYCSADNTRPDKHQARPLLVEIGCGVGNALIPILYKSPFLDAIGVDCSPRAVDILNERWRGITCALEPPLKPRIRGGSFGRACTDPPHPGSVAPIPWPGGNLRATAVTDILTEDIPTILVAPESADFVLLLFTLSALPHSKFLSVAEKCSKLLKPGGLLLLRDYGRYDLTQLRFSTSRRALLASNAYVRNDGTLTYYFTTEELEDIFVRQCGLETLEKRYLLREIKNVERELRMKRVWIQAKFRKPNVFRSELASPSIAES